MVALVAGSAVIVAVVRAVGSERVAILLGALLFFTLPVATMAVVSFLAARLFGKPGIIPIRDELFPEPRTSPKFRVKLWHTTAVVAGSAVLFGAARVALRIQEVRADGGPFTAVLIIACSLLVFVVLPGALAIFPVILVIKMGRPAQLALERWGARRGKASFTLAGWLSAMVYLILANMFLATGIVAMEGLSRVLPLFTW